MTTAQEQVPVLIVGGGYAGLASALFLSHHGVRTILVDRHPAVSIQGRARGINPWTMEIYRPLGLEPEIKAAGLPFDAESGVVQCQNLAGEWTWIVEQDMPRALPDLTAGEFGMAHQSSVEPILVQAARANGADIRFSTQCISFEQDADGITVVTKGDGTGQRAIRADYLIAADGYRGTFRERLGIARPGHVTRNYVSAVLEANLSEIIRKRALFWMISGPHGGGGFVSTAIPDRWGMAVMYDPGKQSPADFTAERLASLAKTLIGRDVPVRMLDSATWEEAVGVAETYRSGRVFLAGDAAHVWPPAQALGANSAVQDAHNLAWKLAAVLRYGAADSLLDSYEAERRPVATELAAITVRRQELRFSGCEDTQEASKEAIQCILGQRYRSAAIIGAEHNTVFGETAGQRAQPGTRAPHLWLDHADRRISVHDLFHDAFVLLTGPAGAAWTQAAGQTATHTPIPMRAYRIGPASAGVELADTENNWQARYELADDGAVLVRPDGYVAWRAGSPGTDPAAALASALNQILGTSS
jgi:putative polyketide hydroxylase